MRLFGLPVAADRWQEKVAGLGTVKMQNLWAVAAGSRRTRSS
jgi:hypothetical protein